MENLVGKTVWIVGFFSKDSAFCDGNGVYASKERALAAIEDDFCRNEGYWVNRVLDFDIGSSRIEFFYCEDVKVAIYMYEAEIQ